MKMNRCMDPNMYQEAQETPNYEMNMGAMAMDGRMGCCQPQVMMCPPIMECPQVQCCHRVINYEVPHV